MGKWVVYCAGNSEYILSENKEPIRMLKSFQKQFGDEIDYVYFTDKDEPNLDMVQTICNDNNIILITGECREFYKEYKDIQYINEGKKQRWPEAHYWYCEAPKYLNYDFAIKCDGDMLCVSKFDLDSLESDMALTIAESPEWYDPFDKYCPNAGFQILNISEYKVQNINLLLRTASTQINKFNGDTPALNYLIGSNEIVVSYIGSEYNYLLFDIDIVNELELNNISNIHIVHFVDSKPYNLNQKMENSIKHHFSKIYLNQ
jgi:hypothetical protein